MSEPLVSILLPVYNCVHYIEAALTSALRQTYKQTEIVVVEDSGNDGTWEAVCSLAAGTSARLYRNEKNLGQYGNKNRALELAHGHLVKFLDGDDILEDDATENLVRQYFVAGGDIAVVFGRFSVIDASGVKRGEPHHWGISGRWRGTVILDEVLKPRMAGSRFGNTSAHLFERNALLSIGGFPDNNAGPGDIETFLKLLATRDAAFLETPVARYRTHPQSMSNRTFGEKECRDYIEMVKRLQEYFLPLKGLPTYLQTEKYFREWMVWAGGHNIFAAFHRRWRGHPAEYKALRSMYFNEGLEAEYSYFLRSGMPQYALLVLTRALRRLFGLTDAAPLFKDLARN